MLCTHPCPPPQPCSRTSKVFTNHQQMKQSGCLECYTEVSISVVYKHTLVNLTQETTLVATSNIFARLGSCSAERVATFWCTAVYPSYDYLSWGWAAQVCPYGYFSHVERLQGKKSGIWLNFCTKIIIAFSLETCRTSYLWLISLLRSTRIVYYPCFKRYFCPCAGQLFIVSISLLILMTWRCIYIVFFCVVWSLPFLCNRNKEIG